MADNVSQDNQHFEQVLSRLDALMKRSHTGTDAPDIMSGPPTFVILPPPDEAWSDSPVEAPSPASLMADTENDIPVLTDIYDGALPAPRTAEESRADTANAIIEELLPLILAALDNAVLEEAEKMRQALASRLEQEVADTIRQRLLREDHST